MPLRQRALAPELDWALPLPAEVGTVQVEAASWLSVVVRSQPFSTAVNGTLVARPVRMTLHTSAAVGSSLGPNGEARPRRPNCVGGKLS
jgi:hypothetical protein